MKLLLDTHAFIWWDGDPSKLSDQALGSVPLTSQQSAFESCERLGDGKLTLRMPLADVVRDQRHSGLLLESVVLEDILALSALPTFHRDPFDRLIVAQTNRGGFHLVTQDPEMRRYPVSLLW